MEGLTLPFRLIKEVLDSIFSALGDLLGFIGSLLSYFNPFDENFIFKDFFAGVGDFFVECGNFFLNLLDWLNPFSENFFVYQLIRLLIDMFKLLFIPEEDLFASLQNDVMQKFQFIDSIKIAINSLKDIFNNIGGAPVLHLELMPTKYTSGGTYTIIDLNWYRPYKAYGDLVLTGLFYAFYLWRLFVRLPRYY